MADKPCAAARCRAGRIRLNIKNFQLLIENAAYAAECEDNYASILEVFCNALKKRDAV